VELCVPAISMGDGVPGTLQLKPIIHILSAVRAPGKVVYDAGHGTGKFVGIALGMGAAGVRGNDNAPSEEEIGNQVQRLMTLRDRHLTLPGKPEIDLRKGDFMEVCWGRLHVC
jgi:hypothetical protein